ncbi:hypothetical protein [Thioclava sp. GXIMD4215]|uniref:hypothetical protein n=1 Tax=Thioclava sp. GXIMD4215 TaxID=3131928 RepID=UPI003244DC6F
MDTQSGSGTGTGTGVALARQAESSTAETVSASYVDSEILALPAGPSPAFRVSLLEQQAARVRAGVSSAETVTPELMTEAYASLTHDLTQTDTGWVAGGTATQGTAPEATNQVAAVPETAPQTGADAEIVTLDMTR